MLKADASFMKADLYKWSVIMRNLSRGLVSYCFIESKRFQKLATNDCNAGDLEERSVLIHRWLLVATRVLCGLVCESRETMQKIGSYESL